MFILHIWGFKEILTNKVRLSYLPFEFVLLLQHNARIMGIKNPVVATDIENVSVSYCLSIPNLNFSLFCPFLHRIFKI
jgi:hypothetical protein